MKQDNSASPLADQDLALLSQYLDGELPAADSRKLEARLHGEPALQSALLGLQELNQRLRDVLAENDRIPDAITGLLSSRSAGACNDAAPANDTAPANIVQFPGARAPASKGRRALPWVYAAAASVVGAIALNLVSQTPQTPTSIVTAGDSLISPALERLSSDSGWYTLGDGRELQTVLTFPHDDGRWCREFLLRGGDADLRAVACRTEGQWITQAAGLESYLEAADAYRPAGATDAEPVAGFISQHAADIALGLNEEQQLIGNGWQQVYQ